MLGFRSEDLERMCHSLSTQLNRHKICSMPFDFSRKLMKMQDMPLDDLVDFLEMDAGRQKPAAQAELARRATLYAERQAAAAERQADAADRAAEATVRYTRYTLWIVIFAAVAAIASAVSAIATLMLR